MSALVLTAAIAWQAGSRSVPSTGPTTARCPVARRWSTSPRRLDGRVEPTPGSTRGAGDYDTSSEDPDDLWPAVQVLAFWSEDYRRQLHMDHDGWRPTLVTEAKFLRNTDVAEWIWNNELHWDDYAADVARAKAKLENVLVEGERAERGVPCLYEECRGARLERRLEPYSQDGEKAWRWTKWTCPRNRNHAWTEDEYARMVTAAHERTKFEDIDGQEWCSIDYAARRVERSVKTIRTWVNREELSTLCLIAGRRLPFVVLSELVHEVKALYREVCAEYADDEPDVETGR
jgi:hypothetical protein